MIHDEFVVCASCLLPGVGEVDLEHHTVIHLLVVLNLAGENGLDRSPVKRIRNRHGPVRRDGVHDEVIGGGVKQSLERHLGSFAVRARVWIGKPVCVGPIGLQVPPGRSGAVRNRRRLLRLF